MTSIGELLRPLRSGTAKLAGNDPRLATRTTIGVSSPEFASGTMLPLEWSGVPPEAKELVLIVEDVDVPLPAPLVHAIAYAIPATKRSFAAGDIPKLGVGTSPSAPGALLGKSAGIAAGFVPVTPIPGHGPHRYVFQVFALDVNLTPFAHPPTKKELVAAMAGHVIARGATVGLAEA
jgi:Raf kinase inhibitor-like YbhB/YbcL family protein